MSDYADKSKHNEEQLLKISLEARKPVPNIQWNGLCHYCEDSVEQPRLFCSSLCAEGYDRVMNRKA